MKKIIKARDHEVPKTVVEVSVYLAGKKLDVCDEQVEHGGMFWPQTMKVSLKRTCAILSLAPCHIFSPFLSFVVALF